MHLVEESKLDFNLAGERMDITKAIDPRLYSAGISGIGRSSAVNGGGDRPIASPSMPQVDPDSGLGI